MRPTMELRLKSVPFDAPAGTTYSVLYQHPTDGYMVSGHVQLQQKWVSDDQSKSEWRPIPFAAV